MDRTQRAVTIILGTAVLLAGTAAALVPRPREGSAPDPGPTVAADTPVAIPSPPAGPAAPAPTAAGLPPPVAPRIGLVSVEPSGEARLVGEAEPGATVEVFDNGRIAARALASAGGEWGLALDPPLAPGAHDLALRVTSPDAGYQLLADQRVSVLVPPPGSAEVLVAMTEPGAPTQVLQVPAPEMPDAPLVAALTDAPAPNALAPAIAPAPAPTASPANAGASEAPAVEPGGAADLPPSVPAASADGSPLRLPTVETVPAEPPRAEIAALAPPSGDLRDFAEPPGDGLRSLPSLPSADGPRAGESPAALVPVPALPTPIPPEATVAGRPEPLPAPNAVPSRPQPDAPPAGAAPATIASGPAPTFPVPEVSIAALPEQPSAENALESPEPGSQASAASPASSGAGLAPPADAAPAVTAPAITPGVAAPQVAEPGEAAPAPAAVALAPHASVAGAPSALEPAPSRVATSEVGAGIAASSSVPEGVAIPDAALEGVVGPGEAAPASVSTVEVETGGRVFATGEARPAAEVRLYVDDAFVAELEADDEGRWSFAGELALTGGDHRLRVDEVADAGGRVTGRAEVPFAIPDQVAQLEPQAPPAELPLAEGGRIRDVAAGVPGAAAARAWGPADSAPPSGPAAGVATPPVPGGLAPPVVEAVPAPSEAIVPPAGPDAAAGPPGASAPATIAQGASGALAGVPEPGGPEVAPTAASGPTPAVTEAIAIVAPAADTVTIRRGDNLWMIARRVYGAGIRYTTIYAANRDQIRDPDLVYPGQVFVIPPPDPDWGLRPSP